MRLRLRARRGATLVESAIVLLVFLALVIGMMDVGVGTLRFNTLSQGARHGARAAIVHGAMAPSDWNGGAWGPGTIDTTADGSSPVAEAVRPMLSTCVLSETRVVAEWPDGSNAVGKRVRVTVTTPYRPLLTFILGNPALTLRSSATLPIAH